MYKCLDVPDRVARSCFTCGLREHVSRFGLQRGVAWAEPEGGVKWKERATHVLEENRMGPKERC